LGMGLDEGSIHDAAEVPEESRKEAERPLKPQLYAFEFGLACVDLGGDVPDRRRPERWVVECWRRRKKNRDRQAGAVEGLPGNRLREREIAHILLKDRDGRDR